MECVNVVCICLAKLLGSRNIQYLSPIELPGRFENVVLMLLF